MGGGKGPCGPQRLEGGSQSKFMPKCVRTQFCKFLIYWNPIVTLVIPRALWLSRFYIQIKRQSESRGGSGGALCSLKRPKSGTLDAHTLRVHVNTDSENIRFHPCLSFRALVMEVTMTCFNSNWWENEDVKKVG